MRLQFKKYTLKTFTNTGITLTPIELKDFLDFDVKRVYYITAFAKDNGAHCHKIEKEFFICQKGTITAIINSGAGLEEFVMAGPNDAMYVGNYVWHGFKNASQDCVLLALSSTNYNPDRSDYVPNYEEYKKLVSELK
ncbi:MAG: FdtA/QdtA family cupin domain-containing protein [Candidatus Magasanikbacteria bacterium]|nr:FdtA/QdtA family cupin domain-containing protein [Candidatus Magasanikbacteria bacterium]